MAKKKADIEEPVAETVSAEEVPAEEPVVTMATPAETVTPTVSDKKVLATEPVTVDYKGMIDNAIQLARDQIEYCNDWLGMYTGVNTAAHMDLREARRQWDKFRGEVRLFEQETNAGKKYPFPAEPARVH